MRILHAAVVTGHFEGKIGKNEVKRLGKRRFFGKDVQSLLQRGFFSRQSLQSGAKKFNLPKPIRRAGEALWLY
jgi:hypothetical protein